MTVENAKGMVAESSTSDESSTRRGGTVAPAAAWLFAFLVLRVFAVSGYQWDTAFAVSTTLSVNEGLSLVFGSLMAEHLLVALLLMVVLPLLIATLLWSERGHRAVILLPAAISLVTLVGLTVSFHIWWLPVASATLFVLIALIGRLPRQSPVRRASTMAMTRVGWVAGIAVLLVAALGQAPWVPKEQIKTNEGTISAYVLSVDSGYLNILTEEHDFVILNRSDVVSRK